MINNSTELSDKYSEGRDEIDVAQLLNRKNNVFGDHHTEYIINNKETIAPNGNSALEGGFVKTVLMKDQLYMDAGRGNLNVPIHNVYPQNSNNNNESDFKEIIFPRTCGHMYGCCMVEDLELVIENVVSENTSEMDTIKNALPFTQLVVEIGGIKRDVFESMEELLLINSLFGKYATYENNTCRIPLHVGSISNAYDFVATQRCPLKIQIYMKNPAEVNIQLFGNMYNPTFLHKRHVSTMQMNSVIIKHLSDHKIIKVGKNNFNMSFNHPTFMMYFQFATPSENICNIKIILDGKILCDCQDMAMMSKHGEYHCLYFGKNSEDIYKHQIINFSKVWNCEISFDSTDDTTVEIGNVYYNIEMMRDYMISSKYSN